MHASIDMNASLHAKRPRAYLMLFSFRPRKASARGHAETHRANSRLSSGPRRLLTSRPYNVPDHAAALYLFCYPRNSPAADESRLSGD